MDKKLIQTDDGSHTFLIKDWKETYHSKFGAIQEAYHVFIDHGLSLFDYTINILEIGFGTGLNAFITYLEAKKRSLNINYEGVELYPISEKDALKLNYIDALNTKSESTIFRKLHQSNWNKKVIISPFFSLKKSKKAFQDIDENESYDLIYYDAFSARIQPELWEKSIFENMYKSLKSEGVLVTYASKSSARRAMIDCGFKVEKHPGPTGRRDMLRAIKY